MSYQAQQAIAANEALLTEWGVGLDRVLDGEYEEAVIYKGPVTGLSHYAYRDVENHLKVGEYLFVKPDPTNKYDPNATGLFYGDVQVGWVPKAMNQVTARAVRNDCAFVARIIRHKEFTGDFTNILFVQITATLKLSNRVAAEILATTLENAIFKSSTIKEQETMAATTKASAIIQKNIDLGTNAAFLEAGRIANNQLSSIAGKKLPIMVRAYADTPMGRLLLANVAMMAAEHFRPGDQRLERLTKAMAVTSYQEVLQTFDIEQMIEDLISNKTIAKALKAVEAEG